MFSSLPRLSRRLKVSSISLKKVARRAIITTCFLLCISSVAWGVDYTWTGATDNNWTTDGNWSQAGYPGSATGDTATITGNAVTNITLDSDITINTITFNSSGTEWITINFAGKTLTTNDVILNSTAGTGASNVILSGPGNFIVNNMLDQANGATHNFRLESNIIMKVFTVLYGNMDAGQYTYIYNTDGTCSKNHLYVPASGVNVNYGDSAIKYEDSGGSNKIEPLPCGTSSLYSMTVNSATLPMTITLKNASAGNNGQFLSFKYTVSITSDYGSTATYTLDGSSVSDGSVGSFDTVSKNNGTGSFIIALASGIINPKDGIEITVRTPDDSLELGKVGFIQGEVKWTGATSTVWTDTDNWSGISDLSELDTADVIIPSGVTRYPDITVAAKCKSLTIQNNANVRVTTTGALTVTGLKTEGTGYINCDAASTVIFTGSEAYWESANPVFSTFGVINVDASTVFTAKSDITLLGNFNNNLGGKFSAKTYGAVFYFKPSSDFSINGSSIADDTAFYKLSCTNAGGKTVTFSNEISVSSLCLTGSSSSNKLSVVGDSGSEIKLAVSERSGQYLTINSNAPVITDGTTPGLKTYTAYESEVSPTGGVLPTGWVLGGTDNVWTGQVSNVWSAPENWNTGSAPTSGSTVIIPGSGVGTYPKLSSDVDIGTGSITVDSGASLDLAGFDLTADTLSVGGKLRLFGTETFTNVATVTTQNTANILYYGTAAGTNGLATKLASSFPSITIATGTTLTLNNDIIITGDLTNNGTFSASGNQLTITPITTTTISGNPITFANLSCTGQGGKSIIINNTVSVGGTLSLTGSSITSRLRIAGSGSIALNSVQTGGQYLRVDTIPITSNSYTVIDSVSATETAPTGWTGLTTSSDYTWTGAIDNTWANKDNWEIGGGVATSYPGLNVADKVLIPTSPSGTFGFPVLSSIVSVYELTIENSASIELATGSRLTVTDVWSNSGTIKVADNTVTVSLPTGSSDSGSWEFIGTTGSVYNGLEYNKIVINSGCTATASGAIKVSDLTNDGILTCGNNTITFSVYSGTGTVKIEGGSFILTGTGDTTISNMELVASSSSTLNSGLGSFTLTSITTNSASLSVKGKITLPTVAGGISFDSFSVLSGGDCTLNNDITVSGNLTNNGTLSCATNTINITPTGTTIIEGSSGLSAKSLVCDAQGGKTLSIKASITLSDALKLSGTSTASKLTVNGTGSVSLISSQYTAKYLDVATAGPVITGSGSPVYRATYSTGTSGTPSGWEIYSGAGLFTWTGTTDTDWQTATNWELNEVPPTDSTPFVVIPDVSTANSGSGKFPELSANISVAKIQIDEVSSAPTTVSLSLAGYDLSVSDEWKNNSVVSSQGSETVTISAPVANIIENGTWKFTGGSVLDITNLTYKNVQISGGIEATPIKLASTTELILANGATAADKGNLTIDSGCFLDIEGKNLEVPGTFSNNGTLRLTGSGTQAITLTGGNDVDSGTWEYNAATGTATIFDFDADATDNDYYSLVVTSSGTGATYTADGTLKTASDMTVSGTATLSTKSLDVAGTLTVDDSANATFNSTTGTAEITKVAEVSLSTSGSLVFGNDDGDAFNVTGASENLIIPASASTVKAAGTLKAGTDASPGSIEINLGAGITIEAQSNLVFASNLKLGTDVEITGSTYNISFGTTANPKTITGASKKLTVTSTGTILFSGAVGATGSAIGDIDCSGTAKVTFGGAVTATSISITGATEINGPATGNTITTSGNQTYTGAVTQNAPVTYELTTAAAVAEFTGGFVSTPTAPTVTLKGSAIIKGSNTFASLTVDTSDTSIFTSSASIEFEGGQTQTIGNAFVSGTAVFKGNASYKLGLKSTDTNPWNIYFSGGTLPTSSNFSYVTVNNCVSVDADLTSAKQLGIIPETTTICDITPAAPTTKNWFTNTFYWIGGTDADGSLWTTVANWAYDESGSPQALAFPPYTDSSAEIIIATSTATGSKDLDLADGLGSPTPEKSIKIKSLTVNSGKRFALGSCTVTAGTSTINGTIINNGTIALYGNQTSAPLTAYDSGIVYTLQTTGILEHATTSTIEYYGNVGVAATPALSALCVNETATTPLVTQNFNNLLVNKTGGVIEFNKNVSATTLTTEQTSASDGVTYAIIFDGTVNAGGVSGSTVFGTGYSAGADIGKSKNTVSVTFNDDATFTAATDLVFWGPVTFAKATADGVYQQLSNTGNISFYKNVDAASASDTSLSLQANTEIQVNNPVGGATPFVNLKVTSGKLVLNSETASIVGDDAGSISVSGTQDYQSIELNTGAVINVADIAVGTGIALKVNGATVNNGTIQPVTGGTKIGTLLFTGDYSGSGILSASSNITEFRAKADLSGTTFTHNSGTVLFNRTSSQNLVTLVSGDANFPTTFFNVDVGSSTNTSAVVATSSTFTVNGNWKNYASFTASGTSAITFSKVGTTVDNLIVSGSNTFISALFTGISSVISIPGSNTFTNLSFSGAGAIVKFGAENGTGVKQTINTSIKSVGTAGNLITLTTDAATPLLSDEKTWWNIELPQSAVSTSEDLTNFAYTQVEYSNAIPKVAGQFIAHDWGATVTEKVEATTKNWFIRTFYWYGNTDTKWTEPTNWSTTVGSYTASSLYPPYTTGVSEIHIVDSSNVLTLQNAISIKNMTIEATKSVDFVGYKVTVSDTTNGITNSGTIRLHGVANQIVGKMKNGTTGTDGTIEYYGVDCSALPWDGNSATTGKQYANLVLGASSSTTEVTDIVNVSGTLTINNGTTKNINLSNISNSFTSPVVITSGGELKLASNGSLKLATFATGSVCDSLEITGNVTLNGNVTTTGNQTYNGTVTLGADTALVANSTPATDGGTARLVKFGSGVQTTGITADPKHFNLNIGSSTTRKTNFEVSGAFTVATASYLSNLNVYGTTKVNTSGTVVVRQVQTYYGKVTNLGKIKVGSDQMNTVDSPITYENIYFKSDYVGTDGTNTGTLDGTPPVASNYHCIKFEQTDANPISVMMGNYTHGNGVICFTGTGVGITYFTPGSDKYYFVYCTKAAGSTLAFTDSLSAAKDFSQDLTGSIPALYVQSATVTAGNAKLDIGNLVVGTGAKFTQTGSNGDLGDLGDLSTTVQKVVSITAGGADCVKWDTSNAGGSLYISSNITTASSEYVSFGKKKCYFSALSGVSQAISGVFYDLSILNGDKITNGTTTTTGNSIRVLNNFSIASGGSFTHNEKLLTFGNAASIANGTGVAASTTDSVSGGTISDANASLPTPNPQNLGNVVIRAAGQTKILTSNLQTGTFNIYSGTLQAGNTATDTHTLYVDGNLIFIPNVTTPADSGKFIAYKSTISFNSKTAEPIFTTNNQSLYNLTIASPVDVTTSNLKVNGDVTVGGNLVVQNNRTLNLATNNCTLAVTGTTENAGAITLGTGLATFTSAVTNSGAITGGSGNIDFNGNYIGKIDSTYGTLTASSGNTTFAGNVTIQGAATTFAHNNGTVIFDGTADQTLSIGASASGANDKTFNNLTVNKATSGAFTVTGGAKLKVTLITLTKAAGTTGITFDSPVETATLTDDPGTGAITFNANLSVTDTATTTTFNTTSLVTLGNTGVSDDGTGGDTLIFAGGLTRTASGGTNIAGKLITTGKAVLLTDTTTLRTLSLAGNTIIQTTGVGNSVAGGSITVGTVENKAGDTNAYSIKFINAIATESVNCNLYGNITTNNADISFTGPVVLCGVSSPSTTKIDTGTGAGNITFENVNTTINGFDTTRAIELNTGTGVTTFCGNVGGTNALTTLTVTAKTSLQSTSGVLAITTTGNQTYTGAVSLAGAGTGVNLTAGNTLVTGVIFSSTVDGAKNLVLNGKTAVTFSGKVGSTTALSSLTCGNTTNNAPVAINGGFVTTTGEQSFYGDITTDDNILTLNSTSPTNSSIHFDKLLTASSSGTGTIVINAYKDVTQSASSKIITGKLLLTGAASFALDTAASGNQIGIIAASSSGSTDGTVSVKNASSITVGSVTDASATPINGLTRQGVITLSTIAGDITLANEVKSTGGDITLSPYTGNTSSGKILLTQAGGNAVTASNVTTAYKIYLNKPVSRTDSVTPALNITGDTVVTGGSITTTNGTQTYNGKLLLASNTEITASVVTFNGNVKDSATEAGLTGDANPTLSVKIGNGTGTNLSSTPGIKISSGVNVSPSGLQSYYGKVVNSGTITSGADGTTPGVVDEDTVGGIKFYGDYDASSGGQLITSTGGITFVQNETSLRTINIGGSGVYTHNNGYLAFTSEAGGSTSCTTNFTPGTSLYSALVIDKNGGTLNFGENEFSQANSTTDTIAGNVPFTINSGVVTVGSNKFVCGLMSIPATGGSFTQTGNNTTDGENIQSVYGIVCDKDNTINWDNGNDGGTLVIGNAGVKGLSASTVDFHHKEVTFSTITISGVFFDLIIPANITVTNSGKICIQRHLIIEQNGKYINNGNPLIFGGADSVAGTITDENASLAPPNPQNLGDVTINVPSPIDISQTKKATTSLLMTTLTVTRGTLDFTTADCALTVNGTTGNTGTITLGTGAAKFTGTVKNSGTITGSSGKITVKGDYIGEVSGTNGTLTASSTETTFAGANVKFGNFTHNSGTLIFTQTATTGQTLITNNQQLNSFSVVLPDGGTANSLTVTGKVLVDSNLTVNSGRTLNLATNNCMLAVTGTTENSGTITLGTGLATFTAAVTNSGTITGGSGNIDFNSNYTGEIDSTYGKLTASTVQTTFAGNVTMEGVTATFVHNDGTVIFDGVTDQILSIGTNDKTFDKFTVHKATGAFTVNGSAKLTATTITLTKAAGTTGITFNSPVVSTTLTDTAGTGTITFNADAHVTGATTTVGETPAGTQFLTTSVLTLGNEGVEEDGIGGDKFIFTNGLTAKAQNKNIIGTITVNANTINLAASTTATTTTTVAGNTIINAFTTTENAIQLDNITINDGLSLIINARETEASTDNQNICLNGNFSSTGSAGSTVMLNGKTVLNSDISFSIPDGSSKITFNDSLNAKITGTQSLTVTVGTGGCVMQGAVGDVASLKNITVHSKQIDNFTIPTLTVSNVFSLDTQGSVSQNVAPSAIKGKNLYIKTLSDDAGGKSIILPSASNDFDNVIFASRNAADVSDAAGNIVYTDSDEINFANGYSLSNPFTANNAGLRTTGIASLKFGKKSDDSSGITQTGRIITSNLKLEGVGSVKLDLVDGTTSLNNVGKLAVKLTGAGNSFTFKDTDTVTVGEIPAVSGADNETSLTDIETNAGDIIISCPSDAGINLSDTTVTISTGASTGKITLDSTITGTTTAINSINLNAGTGNVEFNKSLGTDSLLLGSITVTSANVIISSDLSINGKNIEITSTSIDSDSDTTPKALTLNATEIATPDGIITVTSDYGKTKPLSTFTAKANNIELVGSVYKTSSSQSFTGALLLLPPTDSGSVFTASTFTTKGSLTGNRKPLLITGNAVFGDDDTAANDAVTEFSTLTITGTTLFNTEKVVTGGNQTYNGVVTLGNLVNEKVVLTADSNYGTGSGTLADISFKNNISGKEASGTSKTLKIAANAIFGVDEGTVLAMADVASLSIDGKTTVKPNYTVTASGVQTYNSDVDNFGTIKAGVAGSETTATGIGPAIVFNSNYTGTDGGTPAKIGSLVEYSPDGTTAGNGFIAFNQASTTPVNVVMGYYKHHDGTLLFTGDASGNGKTYFTPGLNAGGTNNLYFNVVVNKTGSGASTTDELLFCKSAIGTDDTPFSQDLTRADDAINAYREASISDIPSFTIKKGKVSVGNVKFAIGNLTVGAAGVSASEASFIQTGNNGDDGGAISLSTIQRIWKTNTYSENAIIWDSTNVGGSLYMYGDLDTENETYVRFNNKKVYTPNDVKLFGVFYDLIIPPRRKVTNGNYLRILHDFIIKGRGEYINDNKPMTLGNSDSSSDSVDGGIINDENASLATPNLQNLGDVTINATTGQVKNVASNLKFTKLTIKNGTLSVPAKTIETGTLILEDSAIIKTTGSTASIIKITGTSNTDCVISGTINISSSLEFNNAGLFRVNPTSTILCDDNASFKQTGTGLNMIAGSIQTSGAGSISFATDVYLFGDGSTDTSMTLGGGTPADAGFGLVINGDLIISATLASSVEKTININSPIQVSGNVALFNGNVKLTCNLTATKDIVLLNGNTSTMYTDVTVANGGSGVANLYAYLNPARKDADGNPLTTAVPSLIEFPTAMPDGTLINHTEVYKSTLSDFGGVTITSGQNFYDNGVDLTPATQWNLVLKDNGSALNAFAEAYNMTVANSSVQVAGGSSSGWAWVSAAESVSDGNGSTAGSTEALNTSITGWSFRRPYFYSNNSTKALYAELSGTYTVYDDVIRVEFFDNNATVASAATANRKSIENTNNEISAAVLSIKFDNGTKVFTDSFIDPECTTSTDGKGDLAVFYLRTNPELHGENAERWNTDATGISAGDTDNSDGTTSTDRGRRYNGNTQDLPATRNIIPNIEIIKASDTVFQTLRDTAKNRIGQYVGNPATEVTSLEAANKLPGARFMATADRCRPVLVEVRYGQEKHVEHDGISADSQRPYDAHNFIELRYSESVDIADSADGSTLVLKANPGATPAESATILNQKVTTTLGAIKPKVAGKTDESAGLSVAGLFQSEKGYVLSGSHSVDNSSINLNDTLIHSLYRDFALNGSAIASDCSAQKQRLRIAIAGYVDGTIQIESGTHNLPHHFWAGFVDSLYEPSGLITRLENDAITDVSEAIPNGNKLDSTVNTSNHLLPNLSVNSETDTDKLYGNWDVTPPVVAHFLRMGDWDSTDPEKKQNYEILGSDYGTSNGLVDSFELHFFDNIPDYNRDAEDTKNLYSPYQWVTKLGWRNKETSSIISAPDTAGGSTPFETSVGGIRASSVANSIKAFTFASLDAEQDQSIKYFDDTYMLFATLSAFYGSMNETLTDGLFLHITPSAEGFDKFPVRSLFNMTYTKYTGSGTPNGFITDLAGNRLNTNLKLKSVDRTPPKFTMTVSPVDDTEIYILFNKPLDVSDSQKLADIPGALKVVTSTDEDLNLINSSIPATVVFNTSDSTAIKVKLTKKTTLSAAFAYTLSVNIPTDKTPDPVTGELGYIPKLYDKSGNAILLTEKHDFSDFLVNAVDILYAFDSKDSVMGQGLYSQEEWAVRDFSDTTNNDGRIFSEKDITFATRITSGDNEKLPSGNSSLTMVLDVNPTIASVSTTYNKNTGASSRVWLPEVFNAISSTANTKSKKLSSASAFDTSRGLNNFVMPNDPDNNNSFNWPAGSQIQMLFRFDYDDDTNPLTPQKSKYCLRLSDKTDISSLDLWYVGLAAIQRQRGGTTILNNVINVLNKEQTVVEVDMPKDGNLTIQVLTLDGDVIKVLQRGRATSGLHYYKWDGTNRSGESVARGMYFIRIVGPGIDETRKVMAIKE